ncbi:MAG: hypothetical protein CMH49_07190 [Myxococcales bacterium]|nr:hypothetical protein [Myxococcales bacterium]
MLAVHQNTSVHSTLADQLEQIKRGYTKLELMIEDQKQEKTQCSLCLYGGTNTGKSSLFNLILGQEVSAAKVTAGATKSAVVSISNVHAKSYERLPKNSWLNQCTPLINATDPLGVCSNELRVHSQKLQAYLHIRTLPLSAQDFDPEHCLILIDTPDHDSHHLNHQQIARQMLEYSDLCIYVTSAQKYKLQSTIDELIYILKKGLNIGVLFNMLSSHQELNLMWQDLQQHLDKAIAQESPVISNKKLNPLSNRLTLLGGLPVIHRLSQAKTTEIQTLSHGVFKALNSLFKALGPYQYMHNKKQDHTRSQLQQVLTLLRKAKELEAYYLQEKKQDFDALLSQEMYSACLLDQAQLELDLSHLLKLHYLSKLCSNLYLLRILHYFQTIVIKYKLILIHPKRSLQKAHGYFLLSLSYLWMKLMGKSQSLVPESFLNKAAQDLAVDLSSFHLETSLLQKLDQQVNTWSVKNGKNLLKAFVKAQNKKLGEEQELHDLTGMRDRFTKLSSLSVLMPSIIQTHELSTTKHDLVCFALAGSLLFFGVNWLWVFIAILLCSLFQTLLLSVLCLRDLELNPAIKLSLRQFYQQLIQEQMTNQDQTRTWWQAFRKQQTESAELEDIEQKLKRIAQKLGE